MSKYVERMFRRTESTVGPTSIAFTLCDRDAVDTFGAGGLDGLAGWRIKDVMVNRKEGLSDAIN
jgi:hypothetical protein